VAYNQALTKTRAWQGLYTVKKAFGFTGCCGFFRFWDQKSPSMGAGIFYPIYKARFLIGEKENQFRLYERGFFRLQNTQAINPPCSVEIHRISSFQGREKSSHPYLPPPPTSPYTAQLTAMLEIS
jgi:hypothetical protein